MIILYWRSFALLFAGVVVSAEISRPFHDSYFVKKVTNGGSIRTKSNIPSKDTPDYVGPRLPWAYLPPGNYPNLPIPPSRPHGVQDYFVPPPPFFQNLPHRPDIRPPPPPQPPVVPDDLVPDLPSEQDLPVIPPPLAQPVPQLEQEDPQKNADNSPPQDLQEHPLPQFVLPSVTPHDIDDSHFWQPISERDPNIYTKILEPTDHEVSVAAAYFLQDLNRLKQLPIPEESHLYDKGPQVNFAVLSKYFNALVGYYSVVHLDISIDLNDYTPWECQGNIYFLLDKYSVVDNATCNPLPEIDDPGFQPSEAFNPGIPEPQTPEHPSEPLPSPYPYPYPHPLPHPYPYPGWEMYPSLPETRPQPPVQYPPWYPEPPRRYPPVFPQPPSIFPPMVMKPVPQPIGRYPPLIQKPEPQPPSSYLPSRPESQPQPLSSDLPSPPEPQPQPPSLNPYPYWEKPVQSLTQKRKHTVISLG